MLRTRLMLRVVMVGLAVAACRKAGGAAKDDALRRFRADLPATAGLDGPTSREALVSRLVAALQANDTAGVFRLVLNRAEFAYLYYPTAREALPPYELDADMMWLVLETRSMSDGHTALHELGGRPFGYVGHRCSERRHEGANTIWGGCRVTRRLASGQTEDVSLFGLVVERHGRFKFVSMANKLS